MKIKKLSKKNKEYQAMPKLFSMKDTVNLDQLESLTIYIYPPGYYKSSEIKKKLIEKGDILQFKEYLESIGFKEVDHESDIFHLPFQRFLLKGDFLDTENFATEREFFCYFTYYEGLLPMQNFFFKIGPNAPEKSKEK